MSGPASDAGIIRREALLRDPESRSTERTLSGARSEISRFLLDFDLHGCRHVGHVNCETFKSPCRALYGNMTPNTPIDGMVRRFPLAGIHAIYTGGVLCRFARA